jgi:hypothetical protein
VPGACLSEAVDHVGNQGQRDMSGHARRAALVVTQAWTSEVHTMIPLKLGVQGALDCPALEAAMSLRVGQVLRASAKKL